MRLLDADSNKIFSPTWPTPKANTFMKNFGCIRERPLGGIQDWPGEDKFCDAKNLIAFTSQANTMGKLPYKVRKRFYCDGYFMNKLDISCDWNIWDGREVVAESFLQEMLLTPVKIVGIEGTTPLHKTVKKISSAFFRSTTPHSKLNNGLGHNIFSGEPLTILSYHHNENVKIGSQFRAVQLTNSEKFLQVNNIILHCGEVKIDGTVLKVWLIGTPPIVMHKHKETYSSKKNKIISSTIKNFRQELDALNTIKTREEFHKFLKQISRYCGRLWRRTNMDNSWSRFYPGDIFRYSFNAEWSVAQLRESLFAEFRRIKREQKRNRYFKSKEYNEILTVTRTEMRSLNSAERNLRMLLLRIHVEKETLIVVLKLLRTKYLKGGNQDSMMLLKRYFSKVSEKLFKKERYNMTQEPFLNLALQSMDVVNSVELKMLEDETHFFLENHFKQTISTFINYINMGHTINTGNNSQVIVDSVLTNSLNTITNTHGSDVAEAIRLLNEYVAKTGNKDAEEAAKNLTEEAKKEKPNKSLLKSLWTGILAMVPVIKDVGVIVEGVGKLFA